DIHRGFPYKTWQVSGLLPSLAQLSVLAVRLQMRRRAGVSHMAAPREVMNIREASDYLGISPDTLYRYVYQDKIPAFKLGNRWKFKKTVLDRWMERKISRSKNRRRGRE
ncbi:MAG: helix-turn-helix domain-containing protein, partial [Terriglobia bacterium]